MTHKELSEKYLRMAARSSHPSQCLWHGAWSIAASIVRRSPWHTAAVRLDKHAERYKNMAIASVFRNAAEEVREIIVNRMAGVK